MKPDPGGSAAAFKSQGGAARVWRALTYSWRGLKAAWRFEAAFRQEVALGVPLIAVALVFAPDRWQGLLLVASVLQVWLVEFINSAIEALADAVSGDVHPMLGRAKDLGSAAVLVSLCLAGAVWLVVFWP
jgi:diacylglycerol kinase (ATP)